jgi:hypothetical protein
VLEGAEGAAFTSRLVLDSAAPGESGGAPAAPGEVDPLVPRCRRQSATHLPPPSPSPPRRDDRDRSPPHHDDRDRPGETCPVSTEGGTRRVQLVREGGGGGGASHLGTHEPPLRCAFRFGSRAAPATGARSADVAEPTRQLHPGRRRRVDRLCLRASRHRFRGGPPANGDRGRRGGAARRCAVHAARELDGGSRGGGSGG